jgi:sugar (pentulose or hexulose) kinase
MTIIPVVAVVDIGKTNKKILLFDEQYHVVFEETERMEETVDEDDFPCEDLHALQVSVLSMVQRVMRIPRFSVKAINFTTYGASFVYVDQTGKALTPLYNYLKPYPAELQKEIYETNGGLEVFVRETSSPSLGSLNSGLQVLRLAREQPATFAKVVYALHLPQYISSLFTGLYVTDITSIGCHTHLWDFTKSTYHRWIESAGLLKVLAPIAPSDHAEQIVFEKQKLWSGIGLHDSSAALIPYLVNFTEPFILISTGTWSISLNPFDQVPLTDEELAQDCLCYLQYTGKPVKAARYFLGPAHEAGVERIAAHFALPADFYTSMKFDPSLYQICLDQIQINGYSQFDDVNLMETGSPDLSYYLLIHCLMLAQVTSTRLLLRHGTVSKILVDGGFSRNPIYMQMLAEAFAEQDVFASEVAQATALGAALVLHKYWNDNQIPSTIINLKAYHRQIAD